MSRSTFMYLVLPKNAQAHPGLVERMAPAYTDDSTAWQSSDHPAECSSSESPCQDLLLITSVHIHSNRISLSRSLPSTATTMYRDGITSRISSRRNKAVDRKKLGRSAGTNIIRAKRGRVDITSELQFVRLLVQHSSFFTLTVID